MDLLDQIESSRFVGEEFLTWLWYRSVQNDGLFDLDGSDIELHIDNQLTLEANLAEAERTKLTGGAPSHSPEAKEALRRGKRVTQAKVRIIRDAREWVLAINARTLAIGSLRIPAVLSKASDDKLHERMDLIDEAEAVVRGIYAQFLDKRLDTKVWDDELNALRAWALQDD